MFPLREELGDTEGRFEGEIRARELLRKPKHPYYWP